MKVAIIDDEPLAVELLTLYVQKTPYMELVGSYNSAVEALEPLKAEPVDLLFLDIQMPELTGIELAKVLPASTMVIFTTAFGEYALESYRVNTVDYLVKPISLNVFERAGQKAWQRFLASQEAQKKAYLYVKSDYKRVRIPLHEITYIEGLKDYVNIHMTEGHVVTLMNMKTLEEYLPNPEFMRVHRSFIVHMTQVTSIDRQSIRIHETTIPISDTYKDIVMQHVEDYMAK